MLSKQSLAPSHVPFGKPNAPVISSIDFIDMCLFLDKDSWGELCSVDRVVLRVLISRNLRIWVWVGQCRICTDQVCCTTRIDALYKEIVGGYLSDFREYGL